MIPEPPRHYSRLFRSFAAIDPEDYQRLIRTYEELEEELGRLDAEEHFELTVRYVDALFATGAYRRHLLMVDLVIHASIERNIKEFAGEDVFARMLFRKAASAYRTHDFGQAQHIAEELIRIYPANSLYRRLLQSILFKQQQRLLQFGRATFIFCILALALVIVVDLLLVQPFYPAEHAAMVWLRDDLFILGTLALVGCFSYARFSAWKRAQQFK